MLPTIVVNTVRRSNPINNNIEITSGKTANIAIDKLDIEVIIANKIAIPIKNTFLIF